MGRCRPLATPYEAEASSRVTSEALQEPLDIERHRRHRRVVGKFMWTIAARFDLGCAVKKLARVVFAPALCHEFQTKRALRYAPGARHLVFHLGRPDAGDLHVVGYSDANGNGRNPICRSTSGGQIYLNRVRMLHFSRIQPVYAQFSCEAELVAANAVAVAAPYLKEILQEMNQDSNVTIYVDLAVVQGFALRRDLERMTHIALRMASSPGANESDQARACFIGTEFGRRPYEAASSSMFRVVAGTGRPDVVCG
jgi:hypothetical protein